MDQRRTMYCIPHMCQRMATCLICLKGFWSFQATLSLMWSHLIKYFRGEELETDSTACACSDSFQHTCCFWLVGRGNGTCFVTVRTMKSKEYSIEWDLLSLSAHFLLFLSYCCMRLIARGSLCLVSTCLYIYFQTYVSGQPLPYAMPSVFTKQWVLAEKRPTRTPPSEDPSPQDVVQRLGKGKLPGLWY